MTLKPAFGLSGSALKVIAMISMVIDHIALYLMEHGTVLYETMRCIGRIAFPVFAFLIAEGFIHTRSRYRYFFTLLGDRKSTRLNSSHSGQSRMPSSA